MGTLFIAIASLILPGLSRTPSSIDQARRPTAYTVRSAILSGDWELVDKFKEELGSFHHSVLQPDPVDVLSQLAGVGGMAGKYPNALTGMRICIEYGADPNAQDGRLDGEPLRVAASEDKWTKMVARLLEYGANPNLTTRYATPLVCAVEGDKPKNVEILLEYGADIHVESGPQSARRIALGRAANLGRVEIVKILLKAGAKVNQKNSVSGRTALHEAAVGRVVPEWEQYPEELQTQVVKVLLQHGADKKAKDKRGKTPLDLAKEAKAKNIIPLLS